MCKISTWLFLCALCVSSTRAVDVHAQERADGAKTEPTTDNAPVRTAPAIEEGAVGAPEPENKPDESKPDESKPDESKPDESKPDESELDKAEPDTTGPDANEMSTEVIVVEAEAPYVPVASRRVRDRDFQLRPHPRPADILRVVPGMFVNQHAGGGKANQYFLRGFDADHGTDIALSVDGIPANMVSHGHGQGYADLNWVIPEVVGSVDTFKGTYSPQLGDFATAGSVDMLLRDRVERSSVGLTGGLFDTYRALGIIQGQELGGAVGRTLGSWSPLLAVELYRSDGPFVRGENNRRYSVYAHARRQLGPSSWVKLAATSYMGAWNGSGQIPLREVEAGRMDRFGAVDPSEGGASQRHSVYARLESRPSGGGELSALAYLVRYRLNLFSNFTFFSADAVNGDQIEQEDDRWYAGLQGRYRFQKRLGEIPFATTLGIHSRGDIVSTGLFSAVARTRGPARVDADVRQASAGVFVQEDINWTKWLRSVVGMRLDYFAFQVADNLGENSGREHDLRVSPKASLVLSPNSATDVFVNAGLGFHSNDARALVREMDPGTPLTGALGYEVGARTRLLERVDVAGSLWLLDLDNEIVWVGDEGVTEARGPTRRLGAELEVRARILDWLIADGDVTVARARFRDLPQDQNRVPLAPRFTATGGLSVQRSNGWYGRFGVRGLSDRPLTEDGFLTAEGFTLFDLTIGYRTSQYELTLAVDNVFNSRWREAQFATASRLPDEAVTTAPPPTGACPSGTRAETGAGGDFVGCEDVHFTPGAPFNAMLTARWLF